jgi:predicted phage terminase large subunit-like protein
MVKAELARRKLSHFVREAWHVLNPGRALEWLPYLEAICLHLEAVSARDPRVRRLCITQPPNTLKSTIAGVCWPAWEWLHRPATRFLYAANEGHLATRDALAMRDLIDSRWYYETFHPEWKIRDDQDQRAWFTNTAGGHRISYSVNARVTGKKGDILLVDDANDAKKVHSQAERDATNDWFDLAFSGRMADERTSPVVVVGQRLHPLDLIGHLHRKGGWVELRLSEEYDPAEHCTTPLWSDPRTVKGEWLRESRFAAAEKADAIARLTEDGYETQHKQNARESAGTWFDPAHIAGWLPHPPVGTLAVRYWDTAASEGETACETAGVLLGRVPDGRFIVIDVAAGKWQPIDRDNAIVSTAHADRRRPGVRVLAQWLEEEGGGSGKSDAQSIIRKLAGIPAFAWKETGDKDVRIRAFAGQWQSRNVLMCLGEWNAAYLAQMKTIPGGKRRDQADGSAGAFNRLAETPMPTGWWGCRMRGRSD